jgi:toxin FitB
MIGSRALPRRDDRSGAGVLEIATERVHDLIVVHRNARDFAGTGVLVYDPWDNKTHQMEAT